MSDAQNRVFEAPQLSASKAAEDKWLCEERAFFLQLPELLKTLSGKWVAIHEEQVVEIGDSLQGVLTNARKQFPRTEVYIQHVDKRLPVAKMLSPRSQLR